IGSIGRGTIISVILVMFVLPQILLLGSKVVDKTSFSMPVKERTASAGGRVRIDGVVRGEIHGAIAGTVRATVDGDVNLHVISGAVAEEGGNGEDDEEDEA
ncbi:MAG: RND transporter, partial [Faecousia sp.]